MQAPDDLRKRKAAADRLVRRLLAMESQIDIVYDTTGEVAWPKEKITPEWKTAAAKVFPAGLLTTPSTRHGISSGFYAVITQTAVND